MDFYFFMKYFVRLMIIFMILPVHEMAHAFVAHLLGDDTAEYQGRVTLNPLAHVNIFGAICLLLTGFGWAEPVPINPLKFKRNISMRAGMALTAAAGPLSNLLVGYLGMLVYRILYDSDALTQMEDNRAAILLYGVYLFVQINIGLAVFNLIPIPPLDGSKIVAFFTGPRLERWVNSNQQVISIVFFAIIFLGIFDVPLSFLGGKISGFYFWATDWVPALLG